MQVRMRGKKKAVTMYSSHLLKSCVYTKSNHADITTTVTFDSSSKQHTRAGEDGMGSVWKQKEQHHLCTRCDNELLPVRKTESSSSSSSMRAMIAGAERTVSILREGCAAAATVVVEVVAWMPS